MARVANLDLQAYVYLAQQDPSGWTWELDSKWSSYRRELYKLLTEITSFWISETLFRELDLVRLGRERDNALGRMYIPRPSDAHLNVDRAQNSLDSSSVKHYLN